MASYLAPNYSPLRANYNARQAQHKPIATTGVPASTGGSSGGSPSALPNLIQFASPEAPADAPNRFAGYGNVIEGRLRPDGTYSYSSVRGYMPLNYTPGTDYQKYLDDVHAGYIPENAPMSDEWAAAHPRPGAAVTAAPPAASAPAALPQEGVAGPGLQPAPAPTTYTPPSSNLGAPTMVPGAPSVAAPFTGSSAAPGTIGVAPQVAPVVPAATVGRISDRSNYALPAQSFVGPGDPEQMKIDAAMVDAEREYLAYQAKVPVVQAGFQNTINPLAFADAAYQPVNYAVPTPLTPQQIYALNNPGSTVHFGLHPAVASQYMKPGTY